MDLLHKNIENQYNMSQFSYHFIFFFGFKFSRCVFIPDTYVMPGKIIVFHLPLQNRDTKIRRSATQCSELAWLIYLHFVNFALSGVRSSFPFSSGLFTNIFITVCRKRAINQ
jgi:hypothetical protein